MKKSVRATFFHSLRRLQSMMIVLLFAAPVYCFDHEYQDYARVLRSYVNDGLVNYAALKNDREAIDKFVRTTGEVSMKEYESWTREQQLAFWINTYNGWFLQIVINHYPIRGGRLIGVLFPKNSVQRIPGIWKGIKITAAGRAVSLDDIEHKILRPVFREPRIHFAIVCASLGCPSLPSVPFRAGTLEKQLDEAARAFVNDPQKVRWEPDTKTLHLSSIFDWFGEDFESFADERWRALYPKKEAGPLAFLSRYLDLDRIGTKRFRIKYIKYDWSLNEQAQSRESK